jgi:hypothetical protein
MSGMPTLYPLSAGLQDRWSLAPDLPVHHDVRSRVIAVATGDGAHVDRNFEEAEAFMLYEQGACRTCFIGRQLCPITVGGEESARRTRLLADCDLVLCSSVSDACKQRLLELGIDCNLAFAGATITDAVSALRRQPGS